MDKSDQNISGRKKRSEKATLVGRLTNAAMKTQSPVRGAVEDMEIVTLLLSSLALALDHMEGEFDLGKDRLALLFHQFGSNLRKLQVGPSGVAYGETVISNIVAVLMNIHDKEITSHIEKQLLDGYNNGRQKGNILIKYSME